jgi:hypothetical protein
MFQPLPSEQKLLKTILEPLLEDFQYWFSRSQNLLESERIDILSEEEQSGLLARVQQSQKEVAAAQMLFQATEGQAGIEMAVLMPWHQLVAECWQVSRHWRRVKSARSAS